MLFERHPLFELTTAGLAFELIVIDITIFFGNRDGVAAAILHSGDLCIDFAFTDFGMLVQVRNCFDDLKTKISFKKLGFLFSIQTYRAASFAGLRAFPLT